MYFKFVFAVCVAMATFCFVESISGNPTAFSATNYQTVDCSTQDPCEGDCVRANGKAGRCRLNIGGSCGCANIGQGLD